MNKEGTENNITLTHRLTHCIVLKSHAIYKSRWEVEQENFNAKSIKKGRQEFRFLQMGNIKEKEIPRSIAIFYDH